MKSFILCIFHNTDLIIGEGWISAWHVLSFRFRANFFNNSMVLVVGSGGANRVMGSRSVPDQHRFAAGWVCGPRSLRRSGGSPRKSNGWCQSPSRALDTTATTPMCNCKSWFGPGSNPLLAWQKREPPPGNNSAHIRIRVVLTSMAERHYPRKRWLWMQGVPWSPR